jgi:hypothetical protein
LSADAVPVLAEAFPTLDECARLQVGALFDETSALEQRSGWASWNLGRGRAADVIAAAGDLGPEPRPASCF